MCSRKIHDTKTKVDSISVCEFFVDYIYDNISKYIDKINIKLSNSRTCIIFGFYVKTKKNKSFIFLELLRK